MSISLPEALELIYSFPLLEDVELEGVVAEGGTNFTTSGWLVPMEVLNRLWSWCRGFLTLWNFSPLAFTPWVCPSLLLELTDTLSALPVDPGPSGISSPLNLPKATKLKPVEFLWTTPDIQWTTMVL